jgi:proteic killer suppression protein
MLLKYLEAVYKTAPAKVPGFNFHGLQGTPKRYTIHVNGPWCITFEWREGEVLRVNLEQYH